MPYVGPVFSCDIAFHKEENVAKTKAMQFYERLADHVTMPDGRHPHVTAVKLLITGLTEMILEEAVETGQSEIPHLVKFHTRKTRAMASPIDGTPIPAGVTLAAKPAHGIRNKYKEQVKAKGGAAGKKEKKATKAKK